MCMRKSGGDASAPAKPKALAGSTRVGVMMDDTLKEEMEAAEKLHALTAEWVKGVERLKALPLWVQAAYSTLTYNPENIVHGLWEESRLLLERESDEDGKMCVLWMAAHQIHRFGAGPALRPDIREKMTQKAMTYSEALADGVALTPKEPRYFDIAGQVRGPWPIIILDEADYDAS